MRQQGPEQQKFREILGRLAEGEVTDEDWKVLSTRTLKNLPIEEQKMFNEKAIKLCAKKAACAKFNIQRIKELKAPTALVKAVNEPRGLAARAPSNKAGNLPNVTLLAEGSKVILRNNLWKEKGLVNGAQGKIHKIIYAPGRVPPELPDVVFVQFDQYIGPSALEGIEKVVPIVPVTRNWWQNKTMCTRRAIPLEPAYAITIHSSQGMTLGHVIIDLGTHEFSKGLTYTGTSRNQKFEEMAFDPMPGVDRLTYFKNHELFKERIAEDKRLKEMEESNRISVTGIDTDSETNSDSEDEDSF